VWPSFVSHLFFVTSVVVSASLALWPFIGLPYVFRHVSGGVCFFGLVSFHVSPLCSVCLSGRVPLQDGDGVCLWTVAFRLSLLFVLLCPGSSWVWISGPRAKVHTKLCWVQKLWFYPRVPVHSLFGSKYVKPNHMCVLCLSWNPWNGNLEHWTLGSSTSWTLNSSNYLWDPGFVNLRSVPEHWALLV
jgi:hypothetical protein